LRADITLEPPDQRLELPGFSLHSRVGFLNSLIRCSVKCPLRLELSFDSFLAAVVSHVTLLASIVVFRCVPSVPNLVPMADSFSIAMRS
jgi:hypothetical protein